MTESAAPLRIANLSFDPNPQWSWISHLIDEDFSIGGRRLQWSSFSLAEPPAARSTGASSKSNRLSVKMRWNGARKLAVAAKRQPFDLIISHGPWATAWAELGLATNRSKGSAKHLAFSFNFTDLPTGLRFQLMSRAFRKVDGLAVFTNAEKKLYHDYFGLSNKALLSAPWGVSAPLQSAPPRPAIAGPYFAALGGEARDYLTLCEVAKLCPDLQFVAIARPHNLHGLDPPANLALHFNLPFEEAWATIWHSTATLLPLRSRDTPCGLVTLIGTMHLGKAQVVTEAAGVGEYVKNEQTGLLVPPRDAAAMASAVKRLHANESLREQLGIKAKEQASTQYCESATVDFFLTLLSNWFDESNIITMS